MKTLKRLLFFIAGIGLLVACSKSDHFWGDEPLGRTTDPETVTVTVPFSAEFVTSNSMLELSRCTGEYIVGFVAEGPGTSTHLGNIMFHGEFCVNGLTLEYYDAVCSFVAANGDKLFLISGGQMLPADENDPPYYALKWNDPFTFTGGTGRFEGASGGGFTHSYNSNIPGDEVSHHLWTGTITLVKGKQ